MTLQKTYYKSPIGWIELAAENGALTAIVPTGLAYDWEPAPAETAPEHTVLAAAARQLDEYFAGERREFDLPLAEARTAFRADVLRRVRQVPFGETRSYRDIAVACGNSRAVRAVGGANGSNRLMIVVPCHRIVGADGTLTGYAGGLWRKEWLLRHEAQVAAGGQHA
ncbi:MAG: methylated-DNA--[protein]-cysteine S-methyltransferase [Paenibacillaceae bacterium]|nr:methylated-DNA--[protein]-cysteine S-methyltransferase [Paenibacillaceae bacterium]